MRRPPGLQVALVIEVPADLEVPHHVERLPGGVREVFVFRVEQKREDLACLSRTDGRERFDRDEAPVGARDAEIRRKAPALQP